MLTDERNQVTISGDGSTIVFNKKDGIYSADGEGNNIKKIVDSQGSDFNTVEIDSISYDGTRMVYLKNGTDLYSVNTNGSNPTLLDSDPSQINIYKLSGNGKKVLYYKNNDLFLADFDGSNSIKLTNTPSEMESAIGISGDGSTICYSTIGFPTGKLFTMNSDGTGLNEVSDQFASLGHLTYGGNEIIYLRYNPFPFDFGIYKNTIDGQNEKPMKIDGVPEYISDIKGDFISFEEWNTQEYFVMNHITGEVKKATYTDGTNKGSSQISANANTMVYYKTRSAGTYLQKADTTEELSLQIGPDNDPNNRIEVEIDEMGSTALGVWGVTLSRVDGARAAIEKIDAAIEKVSDKRQYIGETQNRIRHIINDITRERLGTEASRSDIEDAKTAGDMTELVRQQLKDQGNLAAAAYASELPKSVLNLIHEQGWAA